jgi:uncharacterized protein with HEPN domain
VKDERVYLLHAIEAIDSIVSYTKLERLSQRLETDAGQT